MKKTIALLLAAASMTMGATPMNITWENNTSTNTFGDDFTAVTAVFTLDILAATSNEPIFSYTPNGGDKQYGIMGEYNVWSGTYLYDKTPGVMNEATLLGQFVDPYYGDDNAIIVYTYDKTKGATIQLTVYDEDGDITLSMKPYTVEVSSLDFTSIASLTKSSAVGKIDIYNTALGVDEFAAAIEYLKNPTIQPDGPDTPGTDNDNPTIPEPTTATLSLLALASLAARRRRK